MRRDERRGEERERGRAGGDIQCDHDGADDEDEDDDDDEEEDEELLEEAGAAAAAAAAAALAGAAAAAAAAGGGAAAAAAAAAAALGEAAWAGDAGWSGTRVETPSLELTLTSVSKPASEVLTRSSSSLMALGSKNTSTVEPPNLK